MQTELTIGPRVVRFQCAKELAPQAAWLAKTLRNIAAQRGDDFFAPGKTIQFGWSRLTLVEKNGVLAVHEPDFAAPDPANQTRNDLTVTLTVIAQQNDITNPLGIEPAPLDFLDTIICVEGVRQVDDVILQRFPPKPPDSGWTMKILADPDRDTNYDMIYVYELVQFRPWYLKVLTLPPGYFCVFLGTELDAIINEKDVQVYTRT